MRITSDVRPLVVYPVSPIPAKTLPFSLVSPLISHSLVFGQDRPLVFAVS
ncbi:MAG TPA: hypothetical protein GXX57_07685 [Firmicutes bacterium]|nr:hypothetical protein [Bacillota bacterium]